MKDEMAAQHLPHDPNYRNPLMEAVLLALIRSAREDEKDDWRKRYAKLYPEKVLPEELRA
jgi:hypothetical protein